MNKLANIKLHLGLVALIAVVTFILGQTVTRSTLYRSSAQVKGIQVPDLPNLPKDGNLNFSQFVKEGSTFTNLRQFSDLLSQAGINPAELESRVEEVRSCAESRLGSTVATILPADISTIQSGFGQFTAGRLIGTEARQVAEQCVRQQLPAEVLNIIGSGPLGSEMRALGNRVRNCAMQCMTTLKSDAAKRVGDFQNLTPDQIEAKLRDQVQACVEATCGDLSIPEGYLNKVEAFVSKWKAQSQAESAAPSDSQLPNEGFFQRIFGGLKLF